MLTNARLIIVFSILVVTSGCSPFSRTTGDEVIYAPTAVGTPIGDKVTKDIGPAGGTLSSSDGRLTLTIPQNALAETIAFTIQPITNNVQTGIGVAYRLGPDGKTFTTPLELSVRYDERDLEGTVPEALSIAYQDQNGAWRAQNSGKFDETSRTLTVPVMHFTDYSTFARLRLMPPKATIRVSEAKVVQLLVCSEPGFFDRLLSRPVSCEEQPPPGAATWSLAGPGTLQASELGRQSGMMFATYIAPPRKPDPNLAVVKVAVKFNTWDPNTGERRSIEKTFESHIEIIDRGYRATGQGEWLVTFSGVICSLENPFTVYGSAYNYNLKFAPSSDSNGTWTVDTYIDVGKYKGGGTYSIENIDSDKPRIKVMGDATVTVAGRSIRTGAGTFYLDLSPIDTGECSGK